MHCQDDEKYHIGREIKLIFRANITVQFGTYIGNINSIIRSLERSNEVSN